ncbi:methionine biosynthesis PLP-dependent protein [Oceanobacillus neutriphilus]|uniref:Cystathionine gamma-synthase n=1 Tax=Oceanobacillus neutriphilus TaxID=531815 RepID=A0ABQ2NSA3_9BACI|nr:methionine biosynthesis PLP-dependent protein [Oceanobacillus neutriphilus]GGP09649.1 cystathionine gamma-synthase [Oceanobacillus neutriphilus]
MKKIETALVQLGNKTDKRTGAINPPIYMSTAYQHQGIGHSTGYDYSRTKSPTRSVLEEGFAKLEEGDAAFACSSGMAAIQLILSSLFRHGDHLIATKDIYGGTYRIFDHFEKAYNISVTYDECQDISETEQCITDNTKAIFLETPTNPLLQEVDIEKYSKLAKKYDLLLIVDNTFLTPYLQQPITLGADIVVHSATKYIGGHNDVLAGIVVTKSPALSEKIFEMHNASGATLSASDCWLLIRGLKTLALRMQRHEENAKQIADYLQKHPAIRQVYYPNKGGMLSFCLADPNHVRSFLANLNLIVFAESLGGVESFITYPTTQTHADMPEEERNKRGIGNDLLRFSVGIEDAGDIIADIEQALQDGGEK